MKNEMYGTGNMRFDSMFPGVEFTTDSGTEVVGKNPEIAAYDIHKSYDPPV